MNKKEALIAELAWRKLKEANKMGCKVTLDKEVINALLIEHYECLKTLMSANKASKAVYYTIKRGDTLSGIASKYGTTYQHLAQINGIANPNKIRAGQRIRVK